MSRSNSWAPARPGRLRINPIAVKLPDVHVETTNPKPADELALVGEPSPITDYLWDLPNTWPMCRVDTRLTIDEPTDQLSHQQGDGYFGYPAALVFARNLAFVVISACSRRFSSRFAALGKPFKYALLLTGPDQADPSRVDLRLQNAVVISRSPDDGFPYITGGQFDGRPTGGTILFRPIGARMGRQYFSGIPATPGEPSGPGAFPTLRSALDTAGLPLPIMCLNNIETAGDVAGSYPYGINSGFGGAVPPGNGFLETQTRPINGQPNPGLAQALTQTETLGQWLTPRNLTQNGSPFDPFDPPIEVNVPTGLPSDPINRQAFNLAFSVVTANYIDALDQAIFTPFKASFGDLPCGEWNIYCATQDHQAPYFPVSRLHQLGNNFPIDRQIIKNYSDLPSQSERGAGTASQSLDWENAWNWLQIYQPAGFTPWTTYPTDPPPELASEPMQRVVLESQTRFARACANAAPNIPLMPSVSISGFIQFVTEAVDDLTLTEPPGTQDARRRAAIPYLIRYMLNCCSFGAREFYLFAPDWNTGVRQPFQLVENGPFYAPIPGQLIRDTNFELISGFNKRYKARLPMRNRVWRFSA